MLAYILAIAVGLGSFGLYMIAFFVPEVHRKNDFIWSGVGLFYALILWVCAGRVTGALLLGEIAGVSLLGWLAWETLTLRRSLTPVGLQTPLTNTIFSKSSPKSQVKPSPDTQATVEIQTPPSVESEAKESPSEAATIKEIPPSSVESEEKESPWESATIEEVTPSSVESEVKPVSDRETTIKDVTKSVAKKSPLQMVTGFFAKKKDATPKTVKPPTLTKTSIKQSPGESATTPETPSSPSPQIPLVVTPKADRVSEVMIPGELPSEDVAIDAIAPSPQETETPISEASTAADLTSVELSESATGADLTDSLFSEASTAAGLTGELLSETEPGETAPTSVEENLPPTPVEEGEESLRGEEVRETELSITPDTVEMPLEGETTSTLEVKAPTVETPSPEETPKVKIPLSQGVAKQPETTKKVQKKGGFAAIFVSLKDRLESLTDKVKSKVQSKVNATPKITLTPEVTSKTSNKVDDSFDELEFEEETVKGEVTETPITENIENVDTEKETKETLEKPIESVSETVAETVSAIPVETVEISGEAVTETVSAIPVETVTETVSETPVETVTETVSETPVETVEISGETVTEKVVVAPVEIVEEETLEKKEAANAIVPEVVNIPTLEIPPLEVGELVSVDVVSTEVSAEKEEVTPNVSEEGEEKKVTEKPSKKKDKKAT
ncbi:MAG: hypothetical protein RLZZ338_4471 [Cyanobacteriota bacterium]